MFVRMIYTTDYGIQKFNYQKSENFTFERNYFVIRKSYDVRDKFNAHMLHYVNS